MNSQNTRIINCNDADQQINHHIHFNIVDNKHICIKNKEDPRDYCLDASTLNFETNKSDYSKWIIESINATPKPTVIVVSTYTIIARPTATIKPGHMVHWFYHASTSKCFVCTIRCAYDDLTKMEHDNDGFFKSLLSNDIGFFLIIKIYDHNPTPNTDTSYSFELLGYPCCTDLNTPVATTDSDSKWGIENNKWCGIADSSIPIVPSVNILSIQYNR
ncbi:hypothetical protein LY90DRAFT_509009 [Neocallimastix californiae]|uniref:CBM10 domain-containing protein n=1 Tax=Neocallimastix californiae TaxID=1754190 RepID=A0A1Y2CKH5_9FUNG|nr:hypothetical protein LY90DRAFT_509009 [Neocallimastix californiae]|eukprot:ORY47519.1 hypothetical protein LY90DRAFT_509009 [Neocallimastix californiae]